MSIALQARMLNATDPLRDDVKPFEVPTLNRYWSDPAFAAEVDAREAEMRALGKAAWDAAVRRNHPHISQETQ